MSTAKKEEYIPKSLLKPLFARTESYHKWMLKSMFREHYRPDDTDDAWTRDLTTRQMDDIRLHLSLVGNLEWTPSDGVEKRLQNPL